MFEELTGTLERILLSHSLLGVGASFLAGMIASFSPCIYPLLPVTVGVIGAYSIGSRRKGFLMSLTFVAGIAVTYTVLGILAATMGFFLGALAFNPFVLGAVGLFLCFLSLSLFDFLPFPLFRWQCGSGICSVRRPYISLFTAGMIAGVTALPCLFPIVGTILSLIALQKDVVYGGMNLFFFALGYGVLLVVVGTFTSLISKLPKGGNWLIIIRKCVGGFLLMVGLYFLVKAVILF